MTLTRVGLLVALAACGKDPATAGDDESTPDAGEITPTGYTRLIGRTWELPAGANIYKCARVTVPADMYITTIIVKKPLGTHH
ncbi:MAG TPA: hypothetical protein VFV99_29330, partial [Kofleriaceae bacterium]|nr:hypothetical protein [Kofleriaceae bacterium]